MFTTYHYGIHSSEYQQHIKHTTKQWLIVLVNIPMGDLVIISSNKRHACMYEYKNIMSCLATRLGPSIISSNMVMIFCL